MTGEIAQTESPASVFASLRRDKLALGRAVHCLILEGRAAFGEQYLVANGPVNAKTGEPFGKSTKAYAEWLAGQTKEILPTRDYGFITKLQKSYPHGKQSGNKTPPSLQEARGRIIAERLCSRWF